MIVALEHERHCRDFVHPSVFINNMRASASSMGSSGRQVESMLLGKQFFFAGLHQSEFDFYITCNLHQQGQSRRVVI